MVYGFIMLVAAIALYLYLKYKGSLDLRDEVSDVLSRIDIGVAAQRLSALLRERDMTIATAESFTGGLAAKKLTDYDGASSIFKGGVVCYSNEAKVYLLGVPTKVLKECGPVSENVARHLAIGACSELDSDIGIAFTGLAGAESDDYGNPGGHVFIGLAIKEGISVVKEKQYTGFSRAQIREDAVLTAFNMAIRFLSSLPVEDESEGSMNDKM